MLPTRTERTDLAERFALDVARMRRCIQAIEQCSASDDDLVCAWSEYSDGLCAGWLGLPDDDQDLLVILRRHITPSVWHGK